MPRFLLAIAEKRTDKILRPLALASASKKHASKVEKAADGGRRIARILAAVHHGPEQSQASVAEETVEKIFLWRWPFSDQRFFGGSVRRETLE